MDLSKRSHVALSVAAGALLFVGLFLLLDAAPRIARAGTGDVFVIPGGDGDCSQADPCDMQTALGRATQGDTIYVAGGTYTGEGTAVVTVTQSITLYGGWNGASTGAVERDPEAFPTTLDGERARRVVYVGEGITPTLDGFTICRGNATGLVANCGNQPDGCGGGVYAYNAHPVIVNNVISNNVAAITTAGYPTGTIGHGGGLYLEDVDGAVISGNVIISNTGSTADCGRGGGLQLSGSAAGARVEANQMLSNAATTTAATCAWGGAMAGGPDGALIQGNLIEGNRTNSTGGGYGAGIYQWYGSAEFRGNIIRANEGTRAVYLGYSRSGFRENWVVDNVGTSAVELRYGAGEGPTLVNNVVAAAEGQRSLTALTWDGRPLTARLLHNTLVGAGAGDGVHVETDYVTLFLTNTIVAGHEGVGVYVTDGSTATLEATLWYANGAHTGGTGTTITTDNVFGAPLFVDPEGWDFHIEAGSPAVDAGVAVPWLTTDIDDDPRPAGEGYDLGADELWQSVHLPLVLRASGS
jgi:putative cofactor-binding repeat protein